MTTVAIRQLQYVGRSLSLDTISEETGLSPVSLLFSMSGEVEVPTIGRAGLKNLYQRTAYQNLKESGMSAAQANRFRSYSPETVNNLQTEMSLWVYEYSLGVLAKKMQNVEGPVDWDSMTEAWEDSLDAVTRGFQNSQKTYEDWKDY